MIDCIGARYRSKHEKVCIWREGCWRHMITKHSMHVSLCSCSSVRQVKDFDGFSRHMVLGEVRVPLRHLDMSYPLELREPLQTPQKVTHTSLCFLHTLHIKTVLGQVPARQWGDSAGASVSQGPSWTGSALLEVPSCCPEVRGRSAQDQNAADGLRFW